MFLLLNRIRLQGGVNLIKNSWARSPMVALILSLLGIALFVGIFLGFYALFMLSARLNVLDETCYQILSYLFLFLFAGSVPFVASSLLQAGDYNLLFSSPVPPRAIVAAKLLDATVTNSLQFTVLGIPAIFACAVALQLNVFGWILVPILILFFVLLPALLTALALLILLGLFGVKQLKRVVSALNGMMAALVCLTIVVEVNHLPIKPTMEMLHAAFEATTSTSPLAHLLPSGLFAEALTQAKSGGSLPLMTLAFAKICLVIAALFFSCLLLGGQLLSAANLAEDLPSTETSFLKFLKTIKLIKPAPQLEPLEPSQFLKSNRSNLPISLIDRDASESQSNSFAPLIGLLKKDVNYLFRDSILLSQVTMPMILVVVPFILAFQAPDLRREISYFSAIIVGVILFMQTSILSLTSVGLESQSFWVVLTSPIRSKTLLLSKLLFSFLLSSGVCLVLTLATGIIFRLPIAFIIVQGLCILLSSASLCGIGVGLSAIFPRFIYENPAHRVSAWGLILGFFTYFGYVLISGGMFATAWLINNNFTNNSMPTLVNSVTIALYLIFSAVCIFIPITLGAKRIENYQWEH